LDSAVATQKGTSQVSVTAKQAAVKATEYLKEFVDAQDVRIEEVELSVSEGVWVITLGYLLRDPFISGERSYKTFEISDRDGSVVSMRIRQM
jgi:hypothetical protein